MFLDLQISPPLLSFVCRWTRSLPPFTGSGLGLHAPFQPTVQLHQRLRQHAQEDPKGYVVGDLPELLTLLLIGDGFIVFHQRGFEVH